MPYYLYEYYKEEVQADQKAEADRQKEEQENQPNIPKMSDFKIPKYSMPKISLPK